MRWSVQSEHEKPFCLGLLCCTAIHRIPSEVSPAPEGTFPLTDATKSKGFSTLFPVHPSWQHTSAPETTPTNHTRLQEGHFKCQHAKQYFCCAKGLVALPFGAAVFKMTASKLHFKWHPRTVYLLNLRWTDSVSQKTVGVRSQLTEERGKKNPHY